MTSRYRPDPDGEGRRSVSRDVLVCLCVALLIAAAFSGWALASYVFRGNTPFEKLETTLGAVILLYFAAAILVGPLVGLLLPLARAGGAGAALVGTIAAFALYSMTLVTLEGFTWWTPRAALFVLGFALLVGTPVGLAYRRIFGDPL